VSVPIAFTVSTDQKIVTMISESSRVAPDNHLLRYIGEIVGPENVRIRGGLPVTSNPRERKNYRRARQPAGAE